MIDLRYTYQKLVLLSWCWKAIKPHHGMQADCRHGDGYQRLSGLNYVRAILELYYCVRGKASQGTEITSLDTSVVLNLNLRYSADILESTKIFNHLLMNWVDTLESQ